MRLTWILKSVLRYTVLIFLGVCFSKYFFDGDVSVPGCDKTNPKREASSEEEGDPYDGCREVFAEWLADLQMKMSKDGDFLPTEFQSRDRCTCHRSASYGPLGKATLQRRAEVLLAQGEGTRTSEPLVQCPAVSPISFIGYGITVEPLKSVTIIGLSLHPLASSFLESSSWYTVSFRSTKYLGSLSVGLDETYSDEVEVTGQNTKLLVINSSLPVETMNMLLRNVSYQSKKVQHDALDVIEVSFLHFTVSMNLRIFRQPFPKLYDFEDDADDLHRKVTLVTKTFLRYESVNKLVASVNRYYPNMTIIVVDDSDKTQPIMGRNVKHYVMPFKEGWFAGRNLGLSQVATKYFFYVDDDMVFTENTRLETLLDRMERHPTLDILGARTEENGNLDDGHFNPAIYLRNHSDSGHCLYRRHPRHYHNVLNLPNCYYADEIGNIFLAKTESVRKVGFDPMIDRIGHIEFYFDALGKLRIAVCDDVTVYHERARSREYVKHRYTDGIGDKVGYEQRIFYSLFKNNIKCIGGLKTVF